MEFLSYWDMKYDRETIGACVVLAVVLAFSMYALAVLACAIARHAEFRRSEVLGRLVLASAGSALALLTWGIVG